VRGRTIFLLFPFIFLNLIEFSFGFFPAVLKRQTNLRLGGGGHPWNPYKNIDLDIHIEIRMAIREVGGMAWPLGEDPWGKRVTKTSEIHTKLRVSRSILRSTLRSKWLLGGSIWILRSIWIWELLGGVGNPGPGQPLGLSPGTFKINLDLKIHMAISHLLWCTI
jgi:hypothetical protein